MPTLRTTIYSRKGVQSARISVCRNTCAQDEMYIIYYLYCRPSVMCEHTCRGSTDVPHQLERDSPDQSEDKQAARSSCFLLPVRAHALPDVTPGQSNRNECERTRARHNKKKHDTPIPYCARTSCIYTSVLVCLRVLRAAFVRNDSYGLVFRTRSLSRARARGPAHILYSLLFTTGMEMMIIITMTG